MRPQLATLGPDLIGMRVHRRRIRKMARAAIYLELAAAGLAAEPGHCVLRELHQLAHLAVRRWLRPADTFDRNMVFETTMEALSAVELAHRDELLAAARRRRGRAPAPRPRRPATQSPRW
ncbi:hypothetical protein ACR9E3_09860 [Actinomycetospora sp. C-140]